MSTEPKQTRVRSEEINYLIFRYLQECGYTHAAYMFGLESQVVSLPLDDSQIPPGALLSFVQRGINFLELEDDAHVKSAIPATTADDGTIALLELHKYICDPSRTPPPRHASPPVTRTRASDKEEIQSIAFDDEDLLKLQRHHGKIYGSHWNPCKPLLATGSEDSTARIWSIPETFPLKQREGALVESAILPHYIRQRGRADAQLSTKPKQNDVTALDWKQDGSFLATGSQEGGVRLWTVEGDLVHQSVVHKDPVFSLKWNPTGSHFVTGSVDHTVGVWNDSGRCVKHYPFHRGAVVDIDWKDDEIFVTCSSDANIHMCSINSNFPLLSFKGHEGEINMVRLSPFGSFLASGGDDNTVRLWCSKSSRVIRKFTDHKMEVYTLDWCPVEHIGPALATGSFDATVKLWDVNRGKCLSTLSDQSGAVYSVKYSNDGGLLASGSMNGSLVLWSAKDGSAIKRLKHASPIFEVDWSHDGNKMSVCYENGDIHVLDLRKIVDSV